MLRLRTFVLVYISCEMKTETGIRGIATEWMTLDKKSKRKRAELQAKYRKKRKERLNIGYHRNILADDETVESE